MFDRVATSLQITEMSGNFKGCPNIKVLPFLRFNLMISVHIKMPYYTRSQGNLSEVREKSGKMKVK